MNLYEDPQLFLDEAALTIRPGRPRSRRIEYRDIVGIERFRLGFWGKYRLVGINPFRPRDIFPWDADRRHKTEGISIDVGRWFRLAVTPDDPDAALAILTQRVG